MAHLPKGKGVLLPPFRAWLASNIPAVYDNTMTYYEELCALIKYLQDVVVPALNENAAAITTISEAMERLQKYVDEYFDNLDVQEEINNKLDEMAEDGTLDQIINETLLAFLDKSKVEVLFPQTNLSGDMTLIKFQYLDETKYAIIDFLDDPVNYAVADYNNLINKMVENGFSKFDYAFLTHYHKDHDGGLIPMLNDSRLDFSDCVFYLPVTPDYDQFVGSTRYIPTDETNIKAELTSKGITFVSPTNSTSISVNNETSISFYNCVYDDFSNYYNVTEVIDGQTVTKYNNFSMVVQINHLHDTMLITGDIEKDAEEVILTQGVTKPDLLKLQHHGLNGQANSYHPFLQTIFGDVNVICKPNQTGIQAMYSAYLPYVTGNGDVKVYSNGYSIAAISAGNVFDIAVDPSVANIMKNVYNYNLNLNAPFNTDLFKVSANTDLNNYSTPGSYICASAGDYATLSNTPVVISGSAFKLYVDKLNDLGRLIQTIEFTNSPLIFKRFGQVYGNTNTWSKWYVYNNYGCVIDLTNNYDVDNLPIGDYGCGSGSMAGTLLHIPTEINSGFRISCYQTVNITDRLIQEITTNAPTPVRYFRNKTGSGWSSWQKITTTSVADRQPS